MMIFGDGKPKLDEKTSAEMLAADVRVTSLELRVGATANGVKALRKEINGDDIKR
jgi:hypothetical protein